MNLTLVPKGNGKQYVYCFLESEFHLRAVEVTNKGFLFDLV